MAKTGWAEYTEAFNPLLRFGGRRRYWRPQAVDMAFNPLLEIPTEIMAAKVDYLALLTFNPLLEIRLHYGGESGRLSLHLSILFLRFPRRQAF